MFIRENTQRLPYCNSKFVLCCEKRLALKVLKYQCDKFIYFIKKNKLFFINMHLVIPYFPLETN